jgi:hypothetical protein
MYVDMLLEMISILNQQIREKENRLAWIARELKKKDEQTISRQGTAGIMNEIKAKLPE